MVSRQITQDACRKRVAALPPRACTRPCVIMFVALFSAAAVVGRGMANWSPGDQCRESLLTTIIPKVS
jgi:hypothetical protein